MPQNIFHLCKYSPHLLMQFLWQCYGIFHVFFEQYMIIYGEMKSMRYAIKSYKIYTLLYSPHMDAEKINFFPMKNGANFRHLRQFFNTWGSGVQLPPPAGGFRFYGGTPRTLDGLFHGKSYYKWMITGGTPIFQETSIYMISMGKNINMIV